MKKAISMILMSTLFSLMTGCSLTAPSPGSPEYAPTPPRPVIPQASHTGSLFQEETALSLYDDRRAKRIGDIITIRLVEAMQARKSANTKTTKDNIFNETAPTVMGAPIPEGAFSLKSNTAFTGKGSSDQSNQLSGTITVTVAQVLSNGSLVVKGEKWLQLNQGKEYIRLSGIVRPDDIDSTNMVDSTRVANARIAYSGTGAVTEANEAGWLGRFFSGALGGLFPF